MAEMLTEEPHQFESAEAGNQPEEQEAEPPRESVETVAELLNLWKEQFESSETPSELKQELAYKIVKMGEALSASGLIAGNVKIREADSGVLGFCDLETGEVTMTPAGLELPAEHFIDTLVHEATHAGKITGKKVADEGLTELITRQRVTNALDGVYEQERRDTDTAFSNMEMRSVIDTYDFDKPAELIELYLQTEWRDHLALDSKHKVALHSPLERQAFMTGSAKSWIDEIERALEKAAPRLVENAIHQGFNFEQAHHKSIQLAAEESLN